MTSNATILFARICVCLSILVPCGTSLAQTQTEKKTEEKSRLDLPSSQRLNDDNIPLAIEQTGQPTQLSGSDSALDNGDSTSLEFTRTAEQREQIKRVEQEFQKQIDLLEEKSITELTRDAKAGNGYCQFLLASKYDETDDMKYARHWYREAFKTFCLSNPVVGIQKIHDKTVDDFPGFYDELWEQAWHLAEDENQQTLEGNERLAIAIRLALAPEHQPRFAKAHVIRAAQFLNAKNGQPGKRHDLTVPERQLRYALQIDPHNPDAKILLAEKILIPRHDFRKALEIYKTLFESYVAYYVKIAELCNALGEPDSAKPYLEEAVSRYDGLLAEQPGNVEFLHRRANAQAMLGDHDIAIESLVEAREAEQDPSNGQYLARALGRIYVARAMTFVSRINRDPDAQSSFLDNLVLAYQTDPDNDPAKIALTRYGFAGFTNSPRALETYDPRDNPEDAPDEALQTVGTWEVMQGDRTLGIKLLELAIQRNPRNHEALNNLAYTIRDDDPNRALQLSTKAVLLLPGSASYLDTRASVQMALNSYRKALTDLESIRALTGDTIKVLEKIKKCHDELGNENEAADISREIEKLR